MTTLSTLRQLAQAATPSKDPTLHPTLKAIDYRTALDRLYDKATPDVILRLLVCVERGLEVARAALAYDAAIQSCANDPDTMASHCTAEGDTLDDLYAAWIAAARAALDAGKEE